MKYFIGIDPGLRGGIGIVREDGQLHEYCDMPATKAQIIDWLKEHDYPFARMIIEKAQVMPHQGSVGGFTYGKHFGAFEAIAYMMHRPYHEIPPQRWKKAMGLSHDKDESIQLCERIFPEVNLIPKRSRKPHDGIAEALLIAEFSRRLNL